MKKIIVAITVVTIIFSCLAAILNIDVVTKQCINFQCATIKIPLYLKLLGFLDRHYNYKRLVAGILKGAATQEEKAVNLFAWTSNNIKKAPEGFPIVDDHVWYIIVRGYGASDQSSDVFVTLCNYAGLKAFYRIVYTKDRKSAIVLSFVELGGKWAVFEPYNGVYFENNSGLPASVGDIKSNNWKARNISGTGGDIDYGKYFENLPDNIHKGFSRAEMQSPLKRIFFEFKKWLKIR